MKRSLLYECESCTGSVWLNVFEFANTIEEMLLSMGWKNPPPDDEGEEADTMRAAYAEARIKVQPPFDAAAPLNKCRREPQPQQPPDPTLDLASQNAGGQECQGRRRENSSVCGGRGATRQGKFLIQACAWKVSTGPLGKQSSGG